MPTTSSWPVPVGAAVDASAVPHVPVKVGQACAGCGRGSGRGDSLAEEVDHAAELITYATGVRPRLFRSPYGARCRSLDRALAERDLIQVGWNADPREWRGNSEREIFSYVTDVLAHASAPVILLLHDKNMAAVQTLPRILDWIEQEQSRVAREGGVPIRIVDYSVLLPERAAHPLVESVSP